MENNVKRKNIKIMRMFLCTDSNKTAGEFKKYIKKYWREYNDKKNHK